MTRAIRMNRVRSNVYRFGSVIRTERLKQWTVGDVSVKWDREGVGVG